MQSVEQDQIVFRGALLQVCNDMGKETWKRLCFLYDVPERVREGGRSGVLDHLVATGAVSSERPEEFSEWLRTALSHDDLARKFLGKHQCLTYCCTTLSQCYHTHFRTEIFSVC